MLRHISLRPALIVLALSLVAGPALAQTSSDSTEASAVRKKKKKTVVKKKKTVTKTRRPRKRRRQPTKNVPPVVNNLLNKGSIGLKLGFNLAWTLDDSTNPNAVDQSLDSSAGFQGGVAYAKAINNNIGYRAEVLFAQKGGSVSATNEGGVRSPSVDVTLSYIEIPVMLEFRTAVTPAITPMFTIGAYGGFLLSVDQLVEGRRTTTTDVNGRNVRVEELYAQFDYGMNVGAGAYFVMSKTVMASAELRYSHGFADIENHETTGRSEDDRINNRSFALMAGIHF